MGRGARTFSAGIAIRLGQRFSAEFAPQDHPFRGVFSLRRLDDAYAVSAGLDRDMNDSHLDPPDHPETPECCGDEMVIFDNGVAFCHQCGKRIEPEQDPEPIELEDWIEVGPPGPPDPPANCPHGNAWGDCGKCDHEGDLAFDAQREKTTNQRR